MCFNLFDSSTSVHAVWCSWYNIHKQIVIRLVQCSYVVCVCVCVRACVCACVRACVRACVLSWVAAVDYVSTTW